MSSLSTGMLVADRIYYSHKARLECIQNAIEQLARLRNEWGFSTDSLPFDIQEAQLALRKSYHAELARRPKEVPPSDARLAEVSK